MSCPCKECVRVLDGFGKSLEVILPKLREGFVAPDSYTARSLALSNPQAFFLSPSGETFHNVTVTGGTSARARPTGPQARAASKFSRRLEKAEQELAQTDLAHRRSSASDRRPQRHHRRQDATSAATPSASPPTPAPLSARWSPRSARIERRLQDWALTSERNRDARNQKADLIARRQQEAAAFESERTTLETQLTELEPPRPTSQPPRRAPAGSGRRPPPALAGLEERRRNAAANFEQIEPHLQRPEPAHPAARSAARRRGRGKTPPRRRDRGSRRSAHRTLRTSRQCRGRRRPPRPRKPLNFAPHWPNSISGSAPSAHETEALRENAAALHRPRRQARLRHRAHRRHLPQRPRHRSHRPSRRRIPSPASKAMPCTPKKKMPAR